MYLFYLDESHSPQKQIDILAGLVVFERQTFWLSRQLDEIAERFRPYTETEEAPIELHGSPMLSGHRFWRRTPKQLRMSALHDALELIDQTREIHLIASCCHTPSIAPDDPLIYNFEQTMTRFDLFLKRQYSIFEEKARGIAIFDKKDKHEQRLQQLVRDYTLKGHRWGRLRNFAEVPLFIDSQSSRLIQLADLVAFALNRHFAQQDDSLYRIIEHSFDQFQGRRHGLHTRGLSHDVQ